jgi:hypothetical protein
MLTGCAKNEDKPDNLLAKNKMARVLADQLVIEAYAAQRSPTLGISSKELLDSILYPQLFETHGIDSTIFRQSLEYYENDPKRLKALFEKVTAVLDKKNAVAIKDSVPLEKTFIYKEPGRIDRLQELIKQRREEKEASDE